MIRRVVVVFLVISLLLTALLAKVFLSYLDTPLNISQEAILYEVKKGGSVGLSIRDLASMDVLKNPRWLLAYARVSGKGNKIIAGEYLLESALTPRTLLALLGSGKVIHYSVTIPEGWNIWQVLDQLHQQPKLIHKINTKDTEELARLLKLSQSHPEGLFFPDTYHYQKGMSDQDILQVAHKKMMAVLGEEWQKRSKPLPLKSPYETLILASIVEKETGVGYERAKIAGVFTRRMQKKMRLQTDPTVIYGLGESYRGNITRKHLKQYTPYNTYRINGLPPTPIAMPGRASIHAALHPADGSELYFVAKGDGSHYFSSSIEEHNKAVHRFQRQGRTKHYRSAPK